jgi:hypothetical protein
MVSCCANSQCQAPFRYLNTGRLFQFELFPRSGDHSSALRRRIERFWLCPKCAPHLTVTFDGTQARTAPRNRALRGDSNVP